MKSWLASIPVLLKVLVFIGSGLVLLLFAYLFYRLVVFWISLNKLDLKDRFAIQNDFIKTTAQILGGLFFLATILFTYQNLMLSQKNLVATQEKNITDLYTKAIGQLGSDKLEVRLGGIYALERIARESGKDHWPIMEVLTAYVRENAPWPLETLEEARKKRSWAKPKDKVASSPEKGNTEDRGETATKPDPDIQAILTIIGRRSQTYGHGEDELLDLTGTDLRGADLSESHLEGAVLEKAHLEKADLWDGHLEETSLRGAHLEGTDLQNANLKGAEDLEIEQLRPARNWILAYLPEDLLEELVDNQVVPRNHNERLAKKDLSYYNLAGMDLREAVFYKFNLHGANFTGANLKGSDLSGALGLTQEQLAPAIMDDTTKRPDYLPKPATEKSEPK